MSVKIGGKVARCNGLDCWLAYAPQMIEGLPYIHSLDAQKNLQPFVLVTFQLVGRRAADRGQLATGHFVIEKIIGMEPADIAHADDAEPNVVHAAKYSAASVGRRLWNLRLL